LYTKLKGVEFGSRDNGNEDTPESPEQGFSHHFTNKQQGKDGLGFIHELWIIIKASGANFCEVYREYKNYYYFNLTKDDKF